MQQTDLARQVVHARYDDIKRYKAESRLSLKRRMDLYLREYTRNYQRNQRTLSERGINPNDALGTHTGLLEQMTSIAGNRGYSNQRRINIIGEMIEKNYNTLSSQELDYAHGVLNILSQHVRKSVIRNTPIKNWRGVGEKIQDYQSSVNNWRGYQHLEAQTIEAQRTTELDYIASGQAVQETDTVSNEKPPRTSNY